MYKEKLINKEMVLKAFGEDRNDAINNFKYFHKHYSKYQDYDKGYELLTRITDEEAIEIIKNIVKEENPLKIQQYDKTEKEKAVIKILKIEGITKAQMSRIIGINRKTIRNVEIENSQKYQIPQK